MAIAVLVLLVALPGLPAAWAGLTHRSAVTAHSPVMLGYVTVERCTRGALYLDWQCRGRFQVNDAMAEPYDDVPGVTVANDPRRYRTGDTVDTALPFHSHAGYRWGATQDIKTLGFWLGVLLCVAAATAGFSSRRGLQWGSRIGLLIGTGLVVGLTPIL